VLPIIELRAENENEEDLEVKGAVATLLASLSEIFEDMSSFDEYASDVTTACRLAVSIWLAWKRGSRLSPCVHARASAP